MNGRDLNVLQLGPGGALKHLDRGFQSPSFVVKPGKVAMMEKPAVHQGGEYNETVHFSVSQKGRKER